MGQNLPESGSNLIKNQSKSTITDGVVVNHVSIVARGHGLTLLKKFCPLEGGLIRYYANSLTSSEFLN